MLAKLKAYAVIALSLALAVMYALFNREKAARYKDKAKTAKAASDTLVRANQGISEAEKEGREKLEKSDDSRSHFSD